MAVWTDQRLAPIEGDSQEDPLSLQPMSLVGRESEILLAAGQFSDPEVRLLSLIGPGGVGKTSVALAVADRLREEIMDRVRLIDLGAAVEPSDVNAALAEALGLASESGQAERDDVLRSLSGTQLFIFDGCEHVLDVVAPMIADLLGGCGGLRILVTSRTPLRIKGEHLMPIGPLQTPDRARRVNPAELMQVASVCLFVKRVRTLRPAFVLTPENAETVAEICIWLDGLPMAIEIAADFARLMGVFRLLVRLRAGQNVSREGYRAAPARHRSLFAITEWSYRALDLGDRALLEELAVCADGFDSDLVEAVWSAPSEVAERTLGKLIDGQLVVLQEQTQSEPHFKLLKTVRSFCVDRLSSRRDHSAVRRRHAGHVAAMVATSYHNPQQTDHLSWLLRNEENIHSALDYFAEQQEFEVGLELVLEASDLWQLCPDPDRALVSLRKIINEVEEALDSGGCDDPVRLRAEYASAAIILARLSVGREDPAKTVAFCERVLDIQVDELGEARASGELGRALRLAGDRIRAYGLLEESVSTLSRMGAMDQLIWPAIALSELWREDQKPAESDALLAPALVAAKKRGDRHGVALLEAEIALVAADLGDIDKADQSHQESLRLLAELADGSNLAVGLEAYAHFLWNKTTSQGHRVIRIFSAADCYRQAAGMPKSESTPEIEGIGDRVRAEYGAAAFEASWAEGRRLGGSAVVVEAVHAPPISQSPAFGDSLRGQLTARQFQVALLIARGMTNRQIGRQLDISEWTVVNHVRQVMRKLDVPSRVHIAQWVAQRV
jgi:predicted ATPase/DNA-binding CsgD family transcriptional regulator